MSSIIDLMHFLLFIELIKLFTPTVGQTWALIGVHERPFSVGFHTAHEEVRDPHGIEKVTSSLLLLTSVLLQVEEIKDI